MATKAVVFSSFEGGIATDDKIGLKNSFASARGLDFRKSPSRMTALAQPTLESGDVVQDLVVNEVMVGDGSIYAYGNSGYIYKRSTAGAWTEVGKLSNSAFGEDYRTDSDTVFFAGTKTVSSYVPVSGSPVLYPGLYGISQSLYVPVAQTPTTSPNQSGSGNNTPLTTTLSEVTVGRRLFQSDIEPLNKISVFVTTPGTGNWTLTVHDGLNNTLATATVNNGSLTASSWNDFVFSGVTNGQVRMYVAPNARTYHFHLTSSDGTGSVTSSSSNDLSTCDMQLWADRLVVTKNGLHPMTRFLQYELIGNGNYLSAWEPLSPVPTNDEWLRHRLVFPMEYEVCGLTTTNEFVVVAAQRTTSDTNSIPQEGVLFFWDGTSDTYNYDVPIAEGSPLSINTYQNMVYYYTDGSWWQITSPTTQPVKVRTMPGSDTEFSGSAAPITLYPNMSTVRRGVQLFGYPSVTTNTSINYGIYSWGAVDKNFPESFGYNYILSTGSQNYSASNNLTIGMISNFGDTLHTSWRDDLNGGYGVDVVTNASLPVTTSFWESLVFDNGWPGKQKTGLYVQLYFDDLVSGVTLTPRYNLNRAGWVYGEVYSSINLWMGRHRICELAIDDTETGGNGGRFYECQIGFDLTCDATVTSPPVIRMAMLAFDDNTGEGIK